MSVPSPWTLHAGRPAQTAFINLLERLRPNIPRGCYRPCPAENLMAESVSKLSRRKVLEAMERLAAAFGGTLLLMDNGGMAFLRAGADCSYEDCPITSPCQADRALFAEQVRYAGRDIGTLKVCLS